MPCLEDISEVAPTGDVVVSYVNVDLLRGAEEVKVENQRVEGRKLTVSSLFAILKR